MASAADTQRHGTKRKANETHGEEDTKRVVKQATSSPPTKDEAAVAKVARDFCTGEFKKCLFFYMVERYQSRPEVVGNITFTTLEKYGTCVHPLDSSKMTFRPWARNYEMRRALEAVFYARGQRLRLFPEIGATGGIASICAEYVETLQDLRRDMSIGLALLQKRYESIIERDFTRGYIAESCEFSMDNKDHQKMRISRHWAAAILAHAKFQCPDARMCGETWETGPLSNEMYVTRTAWGVLMAVSKHVERNPEAIRPWHHLELETLEDYFPVRTLVTGFVSLWETGTDVPAPGVYTGVSPDLVALLRSVVPCATSARVFARAYSIERDRRGLALVRKGDVLSVEPWYDRSIIAARLSHGNWNAFSAYSSEVVGGKHTLEPAVCQPLTAESLEEATIECLT